LTHPQVSGMTAQASLRNAIPLSLKYAVSLFFLLSGYLITMRLLLEKEATGAVHVGTFYERRIARIWPLYYFFIFCVVAIGCMVSRIRPSLGAVMATALFYGNWFVIVNGGKAVGGLGILWSVSLEEQFYLVAPFVPKYFGRRGIVRIGAAVMLAAYAVLLGLSLHGIHSDVALRLNPLVEMQFFAVGAVFAALLPSVAWKTPMVVRGLLSVGGLSCWVAATYYFERSGPSNGQWWGPLSLYAWVLVGCVFLFFAFLGVPRGRLPGYVLYLGKISYGLYVYHELVLTLMPRVPGRWQHNHVAAALRICCELALVILLAQVSYAWLERPALRWKARKSFVAGQPL
jgi:peptidoglycan/LPS O-acetylase OafA/YrhL